MRFLKMSRRVRGASLGWVLALVGCLLGAVSNVSHAQSTQPPSNCAPQGTDSCASQVAGPWKYWHRTTCGPQPFHSSEAGARQDVVDAYTSPQNCSTTVTTPGGWLSGGPYSIGGCGFATDYQSLPLIDPATGKELLNYRPYHVDWTYPLGSCGPFSADGMIGKTRDMACPKGLTQWQGYCVTPDASPPKNLGEGDPCSKTPNPIHIKTGNKFQHETDYTGVDGLKFERL